MSASQDAQKEIANGRTLSEPLDSLSIELGRISAEIQSINSGFQAQMQQALREARSALENQYREKLGRSVDEIRSQFEESLIQSQQRIRNEVTEKCRQEFEAELHRLNPDLIGAQKEIARVTGQLEGVTGEIAAMLDDPQIELSKVMRKRSEQAELKAYLNGLRFLIGDKNTEAK